jgi:hypothetical protein
MADAITTYAITAGVFAFLTAVLFASRAKRYSHGYGEANTERSTTNSSEA